ncbi:hypothetical protein R3P38DRAFT_3202790 [Favolaschia claudopus]|uniref:Fork-head domain-containing protein n=1 Tax=Favolaschia claudopus TaxID=2862362 RepID=A0AAW0ATT7_9AGAR
MDTMTFVLEAQARLKQIKKATAKNRAILRSSSPVNNTRASFIPSPSPKPQQNLLAQTVFHKRSHTVQTFLPSPSTHANPLQNETPQTLAVANCRRPNFSYVELIGQAILSSATQSLPLAAIYAWIATNYPYFRPTNATWMNSVRRTLSVKPQFRRVTTAQGKAEWTISGSEAKCCNNGEYEDIPQSLAHYMECLPVSLSSSLPRDHHLHQDPFAQSSTAVATMDSPSVCVENSVSPSEQLADELSGDVLWAMFMNESGM